MSKWPCPKCGSEIGRCEVEEREHGFLHREPRKRVVCANGDFESDWRPTAKEADDNWRWQVSHFSRTSR